MVSITIVPNLHFTGQCAQAIGLYRKALGAEARSILRYKDANDPRYGPECDDLIYHAEVYLGPLRLVMSDSPTPDAPPGNTVSLMLSMETAARAEAAFAVLSEKASIITPPCRTSYADFFASLIDPFGVRWELIVER